MGPVAVRWLMLLAAPAAAVCCVVGVRVAPVGGGRKVSPRGVVAAGSGRAHQAAAVVLVVLPAGLEGVAGLAGGPLAGPSCKGCGVSAPVSKVCHWWIGAIGWLWAACWVGCCG